MKSVFARHFIWLVSIILITVTLIGAMFAFVAARFFSEEYGTRLLKDADIISRAVGSSIDGQARLAPQFRGWLTSMANLTDTHILIMDTSGTVILCSDDNFNCPLHIGKVLPEDFTKAVIETGEAFRTGSLGIYASVCNVAARSVKMEDGTAVGYVTAAYVVSGYEKMLAEFLKMFLLVAVGVLMVSICSAYGVSHKLLTPIRALSSAARSYSAGDFSRRVYAREDAFDEISVLTRNFNDMADTLERLELLRREFIGNVSHELRTPMTVISGYVDGILDGAIPDEQREKYLLIVSDEVKRLSRLVKRMLDITQLQSGQVKYTPRPVNICELARRVLLGFESRIEDKEIEVEFGLPENDLDVMFDPDALTQVLTNLTDNAIKFTPPGGVLTIKVVKKAARVRVEVSNTGATIPPEDIPLVFDRFHKADKSRGEDKTGLGLGLYIVRNILGAHKEEIVVTSEDGLTTFAFSVNCR